MASFIEVPARETTALLTVLAALVDDDLPAQRIRWERIHLATPRYLVTRRREWVVETRERYRDG